MEEYQVQRPPPHWGAANSRELHILLCSRKTPEQYGLPAHALNLKWESVDNLEDAKAKLKEKAYGVFILDSQIDPKLSFVQTIPDFPLNTVRMLIVNQLDFDSFQVAVNKGKVFRIVERSSAEKMMTAVEDCIDEYHQEMQRVELVRKSSRQNRELEDLTLTLEARVEERTKSILSAKEQEEEKLHRIRRLVRFIKDLTVTSSIEDLLTQIRSELRPFHQVVAPALIFPMSADDSALVFFSKSQVVLRSIPFKLEDAEEHLTNLLANQMGRPIAKMMKINLELKPRRAYLFVEHTASFKESKAFETHLMELRRPLEMTIERLQLEFENNFHSFRWEKTFDNLNEPISIIDRDMQVLRSNQKFSERNRKGTCYQLFAGQDKPCEGCPVGQVIQKGVAQTGTITVDKKLFQVQSFPIRLVADGPITNVVNLYEDITARRSLQRKVLQTEKMSAIGLLAGNIAHELNNPLTGLRSLAQVLMNQVDPNSSNFNDLKEIEKAAARSQGIIKNLLEFTKPGGQSAQQTTIDDVVNKTLPFLKSSLRNFRIEIDLQTAKAIINVEPNLLQQVVFNLINNACQAMQKTGKLTVRSRVVDGRVRLEIEDNGVGVPREIQDRIFEPFFTTKTEGHGTGLGLSLSREIIEKFGGQISFKSEPNVLTQFTIELPAEVQP